MILESVTVESVTETDTMMVSAAAEADGMMVSAVDEAYGMTGSAAAPVVVLVTGAMMVSPAAAEAEGIVVLVHEADEMAAEKDGMTVTKDIAGGNTAVAATTMTTVAAHRLAAVAT